MDWLLLWSSRSNQIVIRLEDQVMDGKQPQVLELPHLLHDGQLLDVVQQRRVVMDDSMLIMILGRADHAGSKWGDEFFSAMDVMAHSQNGFWHGSRHFKASAFAHWRESRSRTEMARTVSEVQEQIIRGLRVPREYLEPWSGSRWMP